MADTRSVLFLGRNVGYPVAMEGALKLKELAYIHAEGFRAAASGRRASTTRSLPRRFASYSASSADAKSEAESPPRPAPRRPPST